MQRSSRYIDWSLEFQTKKKLLTLGFERNPKCILCQSTEEIAEHILLKCKIIASARKTHLCIGNSSSRRQHYLLFLNLEGSNFTSRCLSSFCPCESNHSPNSVQSYKEDMIVFALVSDMKIHQHLFTSLSLSLLKQEVTKDRSLPSFCFFSTI